MTTPPYWWPHDAIRHSGAGGRVGDMTATKWTGVWNRKEKNTFSITVSFNESSVHADSSWYCVPKMKLYMLYCFRLGQCLTFPFRCFEFCMTYLRAIHWDWWHSLSLSSGNNIYLYIIQISEFHYHLSTLKTIIVSHFLFFTGENQILKPQRRLEKIYTRPDINTGCVMLIIMEGEDTWTRGSLV